MMPDANKLSSGELMKGASKHLAAIWPRNVTIRCPIFRSRLSSHDLGFVAHFEGGAVAGFTVLAGSSRREAESSRRSTSSIMRDGGQKTRRL